MKEEDFNVSSFSEQDERVVASMDYIGSPDEAIEAFKKEYPQFTGDGYKLLVFKNFPHFPRPTNPFNQQNP